ncbi:MAG: hypothetical protein GX053_04340 [Tissierella sp.]|nr:hypothetical protein [Tissierella sp.]
MTKNNLSSALEDFADAIKNDLLVVCIIIQSIGIAIDKSGTVNKFLCFIHIVCMVIAGLFWIIYGIYKIRVMLDQDKNFIIKSFSIFISILLIIIGILAILAVLT